MKQLYRRLLLMACVSAFSPLALAQSPYATKVFEYKPAPGQYINDGFGSPSDAESVLGPSDNGMVSLGGFGGYIVVGFDQPVKNDPQNPYGVDFTVIANGFPGWSEPGAIMVMEDANNNGLPDDTWYELAGSEYHFRHSKQVNVTYFNPRHATARDVLWESDLGETGVLRENIFHAQPYYPQPNIFSNVGADHETYSGRRINTHVDRSNPFYITSGGMAFGYVDNKLINDTPTVPRNPYYDDDNGSSADGFDLSWAVDANGKPVTLSQIHFIKVYNAAQADVGWLGESSTEVENFNITTPDPTWVPRDFYMHVIGSAPFQVLKGDHYTFEGKLFKNGIPQEMAGTWSVSDESVGTIDMQGVFTALSNGEVTIQYAADPNVDPAVFTIHVVELIDIELTTNDPELYVNEKSYVSAEGIDTRDEPDTHFAYDAYTFTVDDASLAEVSDEGIVTAKAAGMVTVTATSKSNTSLSKSTQINITDAPGIKVVKDHAKYLTGTTTARIDLRTFLTVDGDGQIFSSLKSNDNPSILQGSIDDYRYLDLTFAFGAVGKSVVTVNAVVYGTTKEIPLTIEIAPETATVKSKKIVFVNGGQFGSKNGNVQLYDPSENTVEKLADFDKAQSVQDLLVDGRFAYVSAEYDLIKYDLVLKKEVAKRYLEDLSADEADGKGSDGAGLNHSMAIYKDWVIATRQNSYGPPEDGYNVRIYNKNDLTLVKKIAVSAEASDVLVRGDSAFVALNGGFMGASGQLAIIDLVNLEKKEEYDFGADGTSIMQLFEKDGTLYILGEGKALTYNIKQHAHQRYSLGIGHNDYSSSPLATAVIGDKLYTKLNWGNFPGENKGFGVVDLKTMTVTENDLIGMNTDTEIQSNGYALMASAYDQDDARFYFTFGQWWGNGLGRIYTKEGSAAGSFDHVEDSPERLAVGYAYVNQKPYAAKELIPVTLHEDESFAAALGLYFKDADGEPLVFTATSTNPVLPTWITLSDDKLTLRAEPGVPETTLTLTVTATDPGNAAVSQEFLVTVIPVDDAPVLMKPIADITLDENAPPQAIALAGVFEDEDNDASAMVYSIIENTNAELVSTVIANDGLTLSFARDQFGTSDLTVQVLSGSQTATAKFTVTVKENHIVGIADEPIVTALYPNPVTDELYIRMNRAGKATLQITRTDGTPAFNTQITSAETTLRLGSLPPALYILIIEQGDEKIIRKIVKK